MHYEYYRPHEALQVHIASYFSIEVKAASGERELVLPDGTHGLIFVQNAGFVRESGRGKEQQIKGSYLFGQKTKSVYYSLDTPGLSCFGVKFQPTGLQAMIGVQASEFTDNVEGVENVMTKEFVRLSQQLADAASDSAKAGVLDSFFLTRLPEDTLLNLTNTILDFIHHHQGCLDISEISRHFGLTYKRIERLFHKYVGLTPKTYCRLTRFHTTLQAIGNTRHGNLTRLCYESGYYDQMHFIREVRRFTSVTPKDLYCQHPGQIGSHQALLVSARLKLKKAS